MTKEQFAAHLTQQLYQIYPQEDYTIRIDSFIKNNNTMHYGIIIRKNTECFAPTIYIDDFYDDYLKKKLTTDEIAAQVHQIMTGFSHHSEHYQTFSVRWEDCKSKIAYRVISQERNKDLLNRIPYIPFLDFALVFYIVYDISEQGLESICVTEDLCSRWGVSTQELLRMAEENTPRIFASKVETMEGFLCEYLGCKFNSSEEEHPDIYVFSNNFGINGASVLVYKNLIHEFAEQLQSNLYVLPSSIHELLVIPEFAVSTSLPALSNLVRTINQTHVLEEEILSDRAYYYEREEKRFLM